MQAPTPRQAEGRFDPAIEPQAVQGTSVESTPLTTTAADIDICKAAQPTTTTIERAAHLALSFEAWRVREICQDEGIPDAAISAGFAAAARYRDNRAWVHYWYGDPAYGSYHAPEAISVEQAVQAELNHGRAR